MIAEEEKQIHDPNFWDNSKAAEAVMKKIRNIKVWTESYAGLKEKVEDLAVLFEFAKEGEVTPEEVDKAHDKCLTVLEDLEFKKNF